MMEKKVTLFFNSAGRNAELATLFVSVKFSGLFFCFVIYLFILCFSEIYCFLFID